MIKWNKRFKNVHAFETQASSLKFRVIDNTLIIPQDIHLSFRIYSKNFYIAIPSETTFTLKTMFNPKNTVGDFWLYVFLDKDAKAELCKTYIDPFDDLFGSEFPDTPKPGQLFFNRNASRMFVWNGTKWVEHDAIVLGKFTSDGECTNLYNRQSQGGFKQGAFIAEAIQFINENPVRVFESSGYSFLTIGESQGLTFDTISNIRLDTLLHRTIAAKNLDRFVAVIRSGDGIITNADLQSDDEAVAVTITECEAGSECLILEKGFIYDRTRQWPHTHNTRLYYDTHGKLTNKAPSLKTSHAVQEIGHVVDIYTIYIDPREKIILNPP